MRKLTLESIAESLDRLVATKGDECYMPPSGPGGDCHYVHSTEDGLEPGCMWGQVFVDHEYDYDQLSHWEGNAIRGILRDYVDSDLDGRVREAAMYAQEVQDKGHTYYQAVMVFYGVLEHGTKQMSPIE